MWLLFALLSAVFSSLRKVSEKQLTQNLHTLTLGWAAQLAALPFIGGVMLATHKFVNPFSLHSNFWSSIAVITFVLAPINTYLYFSSLRHGELSRVAPIMSLWPGGTMLLGALFLHQLPTIVGLLGITLTIMGVALLNTKPSAGQNNFRHIWSDTGSRHALYGVAVVSLSSTIGVIAIHAANPIYYSFVNAFGALIVQYAIALIYGVRQHRQVWELRKSLARVGTTLSAAYLFYTMAASSGPLAYVSSIRSSGNVLGSMLGYVYFKERATKRKLISIGIIIFGSVLLAVFG